MGVGSGIIGRCESLKKASLDASEQAKDTETRRGQEAGKRKVQEINPREAERLKD